ncbi:uncharacterized protein LOC130892318 [Diorhabda carinulata]|uniref:uncharacterized protein LOC130892318 n=2 Tax=Diorhabda TaxID=217246 RepID=UPI0025A2227B|nr:uncharacterized protein LOC130892318 [Diorhabda carinulata]
MSERKTELRTQDVALKLNRLFPDSHGQSPRDVVKVVKESYQYIYSGLSQIKSSVDSLNHSLVHLPKHCTMNNFLCVSFLVAIATVNAGFAGSYGGHEGYGGDGGGHDISHTVEITKHVPIPVYKHEAVPIPHTIPVPIPKPVAVPVPQPYPVHVKVPQPVAVPVIKTITIPVEKPVPYKVEKEIPYHVEKPVPVPVEKHVPIKIPKPVPVKVPVYKVVYHHSKH